MAKYAITVPTSERLRHLVDCLSIRQIEDRLADAVRILLDGSDNTLDEVVCIIADNADEYRAVASYYGVLCRVICNDSGRFFEGVYRDENDFNPDDVAVRVSYNSRYWSCLVVVVSPAGDRDEC